MRSLLFHCKSYRTKVESLANRPDEISPEEITEKEQLCKNCIVALITVEEQDDPNETSAGVAEEILKMSQEIGRDTVVILPFAHLSNNLAKSKVGIQTIELVENILKQKVKVLRAHFGSHKELLIDIYGHPGNARYREF